MWPCVKGDGVFHVLSPPRCRFQLSGGSSCGWTATVVTGRAVALAAVWRAGAVPSGLCGRLFSLDLWLASLALVLWCSVVRRVAPCRAVVCRSVPRRVASCCGVLCFGVPCKVRCTVARWGAVCRAASCCAVLGR